MNPQPSLLWHHPQKEVKSILQDCLEQAVNTARTTPVRVFFRADDIGVPGERFFRLMELFVDHQVPLCAAVVPAWLNPQRWNVLRKMDANSPHLWCWHQHGWRHVCHEIEGKKQEFGPRRAIGDIRQDIVRGREKLEQLMQDRFCPVFTPPWNRCDARSLAILKSSGFKAVSRHHRSMPKTGKDFPDFSINVDLHTRSEITPEDGWQGLWNELRMAVSSGTCGIMIHHQRMNPKAFEFLDMLLDCIHQDRRMRPVHFADMLHA
jgi:hypothetical protein